MAARCAALTCLVVLLAAAPAAQAAEYSIEASTSSQTFTPAGLTVNVGDTVTVFRAAGGMVAHNTNYDDLAASCPDTPIAAAWSCPRTFAAVGDYVFHCDLHPLMTGTVHVLAAPPGGGGGGGGGTGTPPGSQPDADTVAPAVELGGAASQRVLRRRAVVVTVAASEAATLTATGTVSVRAAARVLRLRKATAVTAGGEVVTLRLGLPRKTRAAVRKALAAGRKATAKLRITATDSAGNRHVETRRVRLRR